MNYENMNSEISTVVFIVNKKKKSSGYSLTTSWSLKSHKVSTNSFKNTKLDAGLVYNFNNVCM